MRLTLYPTSGEGPPLRPAPATRPWMDASPQGFAYRCLPLNIANAHGWEILSPSSFRARWNGGSGKDTVEIVAGENRGWLPLSHFGCGVLTFHVGYLVRTEPGVDLWVSGPPNAPKDGIQPLTGVVETDWNPATFTMNWIFTRTDHWIEFEKGEPYCFFFPLARRTIDEAAPEICDLEESPEVRAALKAWSESRSRFTAELYVPGSKAREEKWQKDYYLGRGAEKASEAAHAPHRSKLRLPTVKDLRPKNKS